LTSLIEASCPDGQHVADRVHPAGCLRLPSQRRSHADEIDELKSGLEMYSVGQ